MKNKARRSFRYEFYPNATVTIYENDGIVSFKVECNRTMTGTEFNDFIAGLQDVMSDAHSNFNDVFAIAKETPL